MSNTDDFFNPDKFRELLGDFVQEVWDNPSQASREAGVDYSDLRKTIQGKRKKLPKAWEINALLNYALFSGGLSEARYQFWYENLHKRMLAIKTLDAWLYSETDGRIRNADKLRLKENEEHNKLLHENLAKELPYLDQVVDRVFKAGGITWSVTTIYLVIRRSRHAKGVVEIIVPSDWQVYLLDAADTFIRIDWADLVADGPERFIALIRSWPTLARKVIAWAVSKTLGGS
ncbi:MAG: hypothetical protein FOGNACKC_02880 [Anaerolineae bacterium]|nr:hypothetical protein [Anaerolineae bacterium]